VLQIKSMSLKTLFSDNAIQLYSHHYNFKIINSNGTMLERETKKYILSKVFHKIWNINLHFLFFLFVYIIYGSSPYSMPIYILCDKKNRAC